MKKLFTLMLFVISQIAYADSAVIFTYHRFGESSYPSTNIHVDQFEKQLDYLEKNKFNVWPLSKIIRYVKSNTPLPKNTVAITIDDAYKSIYDNAYPLLKKKKYPFTVFVNTSVISKDVNSFMDWSDMREMKLHGAEFANHSHTHDVFLPQKNETKKQWQNRLKAEVIDAQKELQNRLGEDTNENPKLFSYPYGEYNLETAEYVKSLGYVCVTQISGAFSSDGDLKIIPRFPMSEKFGKIDAFALKANTLPLPISNIPTYDTVVKGENPPTLTIKLKYPLKNMNCFLSSGERIDVKWISNTQAVIKANRPLKAPRDRYTCTARYNKKRWYWYSHLWIINNNEK